MNKNALKNKIQTYKMRLIETVDMVKSKLSKKEGMDQNQIADEASLESFPASDPPGHISKSYEDKSVNKPTLH